MNDDLEAKLAALQSRLAVLEAERAPRHRRAWAKLLVTGVVVLAATASAQLVTFNPDEPAVAAAINDNFTQLRTWLEAKVGSVAGAGVTAVIVTTPGAVSAGSVAATGAVTAATMTASGRVTAANATVTGTTTTTALVVAGGLPITIEAELARTLANGATEQLIDIAPDNGRRVCFLSGMEVHDSMTNQSQAFCFVERNATGWQLRIDVDTGLVAGASPGSRAERWRQPSRGDGPEALAQRLRPSGVGRAFGAHAAPCNSRSATRAFAHGSMRGSRSGGRPRRSWSPPAAEPLSLRPGSWLARRSELRRRAPSIR